MLDPRPISVASPAMPPLDPRARPLSHFEFWPDWKFYAPLVPWVGWLALRHGGLRSATLANPGFPAGGLVGESKQAVLDSFREEARSALAPFVTIRREGLAATQLVEAEKRMHAAGLSYPVVAKPDLGCRGAGVRPIAHEGDLLAYFQAFPEGEAVMLQQLVDAEGEAGIFYVRRPGYRAGKVVSLTLKYAPTVFGDGYSSVEDLVRADPRAGQLLHLYLPRLGDRRREIPKRGEAVRLVFAGSHSRGAIFRNGNRYVTRALTTRFDRIADAIPDFHFGRFDVRFDNFGELQQGRGFTIVELNGAGAEATHIWDSATSLTEAWRALARQYALLFEIGAANRKRGHVAESLGKILSRWRREKRAMKRYPLSA